MPAQIAKEDYVEEMKMIDKMLSVWLVEVLELFE